MLAQTWGVYAASEADPDEPRLRRWRREAEALLAEGRAMLGPKSAHAAALSARPEAGAALREAVSALARAHTDQACRAFKWLAREVERTARASGTLAFHAPRYDELTEWAHALDALDAVPERIRQRLAAWREAHEAWLRRRAALETYAERVEALRTQSRPDRPEWRQAALALAETGRAVLGDAPDWRAHLEAAPDVRHRVAAALTTLCGELAAAGGARPPPRRPTPCPAATGCWSATASAPPCTAPGAPATSAGRSCASRARSRA